MIDEEQPKELQKAFVWTQYYDLSAIYAWLDELLVAYPNILTNYNFGKSYENRTLRAVKLSHNEVNIVKFSNDRLPVFIPMSINISSEQPNNFHRS